MQTDSLFCFSAVEHILPSYAALRTYAGDTQHHVDTSRELLISVQQGRELIAIAIFLFSKRLRTLCTASWINHSRRSRVS